MATPWDLSLLAQPGLQNFLLANEHLDEKGLVLKNLKILGVSGPVLASQLAGRRKAKTKLPIWHKTPGIIYPPSLSLEQCSSERTAQFKSHLVQRELAGSSLKGLDLTSGFGVDSFFISRTFSHWDCVEPDDTLIGIARHNLGVLAATNISFHSTTAEAFLLSSPMPYNLIIIDPSRRVGSGKVFRFSESEPNLGPILPVLFKASANVLIKAAPLIDLQQGASELENVKKILVVAVDNECKEVLFWCSRVHRTEPLVTCADLSKSSIVHTEFTFLLSEERAACSTFSGPLSYLYEPSAAILKAGAFKTIGVRFNLHKLQASTHLYTSNQLVADFPGRIFRILNEKPRPEHFHRLFPGGKVNVLTRNYPLSPARIKMKYALHDGGDGYLIGFSGKDRKFLVQAERLR